MPAVASASRSGIADAEIGAPCAYTSLCYRVPMQFLPSSAGPPHRRDRGGDRIALARLLLLCCSLGVVATAFPWTHVDVVRLFGEFMGPIAARTNEGFTCVMTCLLTALLVLSEGHSQQSRASVRSSCPFLLGTAAVVMLWRMVEGPGEWRGVEVVHSVWFFVASVAVVLGVFVARARLATMSPPAAAR